MANVGEWDVTALGWAVPLLRVTVGAVDVIVGLTEAATGPFVRDGAMDDTVGLADLVRLSWENPTDGGIDVALGFAEVPVGAKEVEDGFEDSTVGLTVTLLNAGAFDVTVGLDDAMAGFLVIDGAIEVIVGFEEAIPVALLTVGAADIFTAVG